MNKIYLAPKNDKTIRFAKDIKDFDKFIDKFKKDEDCLLINDINKDEIKKIIIYSPLYFKEIYNDYKIYIQKDKIEFLLFGKLTIKSYLLTNIYYSLIITFLDIKKNIINLSKKSETSKVRNTLKIFCNGNGVDIGFGGDPILKSAITIDLPSPYAKYKANPLHLRGSGDNLYWFKDTVLDYVYSSHLLEDFENTEEVINEWLRVIKIGGNLVLFLPDEQIYREYNEKLGKQPNHNHIHDNFSLQFIKEIINKRNDIKIIHEVAVSNIYSFELVIKKIK
jgi:SAM-dependent methyltransferase